MSDIFIGYRRDDGGVACAIYEKLLDWFDTGQAFLDHENLAPMPNSVPNFDQAVKTTGSFLHCNPVSRALEIFFHNETAMDMRTMYRKMMWLGMLAGLLVLGGWVLVEEDVLANAACCSIHDQILRASRR